MERVANENVPLAPNSWELGILRGPLEDRLTPSRPLPFDLDLFPTHTQEEAFNVGVYPSCSRLKRTKTHDDGHSC